jgi:hypothetical protein
VTNPRTALFDGHPPQSLDKDERYTPAWVFQGLGLTFDLDPASPGEGNGDCVPARRKLTKDDDGLASEWVGLVWLNPPFSNATAWANRFMDHANGIFLGPIANGRWTHQMMKSANLLWLCRDFAFTHPTHSGKRSSMPLFFASYGADASDGLRRLAVSARHEGVLVGRVKS